MLYDLYYILYIVFKQISINAYTIQYTVYSRIKVELESQS